MKVLGDRYELGARIGGGGMADIFRAHDRTLDREIALKVLRAHLVSDSEFVERFHREAEALAAIRHPGIVRVLDWGASEDGPFIAMELIGGGTLRDRLRSRGRLPQGEASDLAASIADALEAAHLRGVLHRDLKPDNVLLDEGGRPQLADFGIARISAATALTRSGQLLGTPQYLAPEQMTGDVVDERADVYALGVLLYEMLTGSTPTGGTTPSEIVSRRLRLDPRPAKSFAPVSAEVNDIVMRALARDPARRFSRAAELRDALRALSRPAPAPQAVRPPRARVVWRPVILWMTRLGVALATLIAVVGGAAELASSRASPSVVSPPAASPAVAAPGRFTPSAAPTASPSRTFEPTPAPVPDPTPEPTPASAPTPTAVARAAPGPADTILTFYELISSHEYGPASALWSSRMKATYPPSTNIWGRFDATQHVVPRSAAVTSATPTSAAVAVDLLETMTDGKVRRWIGTWYLVRSGSGWLLDQPGLRPG